MSIVINGETWFSTDEAAAHSGKYLSEHRGIDGKGYTEWRLRQLAKEAVENPDKAKIRAMKVSRNWLIEQASFERFLREDASPHSPHAAYDKTLNDGRIITIRSRK